MPSVTTLQEEFTQYKTELTALESTIQQMQAASTDPALATLLSAISQTLTTLETFVPESSSSPVIHQMANQAVMLINRVRASPVIAVAP